MDRLVRRVQHGLVPSSNYQAVIERLAAYEDTGLTPQEIMDGKLLTGWIPVSEQPPEIGQIVLIYNAAEIPIHTAEYKGKNKLGDLLFFTAGDNWGKYEYVTHWMPLPQPPKEEK